MGVYSESLAVFLQDDQGFFSKTRQRVGLKPAEIYFIVMGIEKKGLISKTLGDNVVGSVLKRSMVPVLVVPFSN